MLSKLCHFLNSENQHNPLLIVIQFSRLYLKTLYLLLNNGFIRGFFIGKCDNSKSIYILLKYVNGRKLFKFMRVKQQRRELNFNFQMTSTKDGLRFNAGLCKQNSKSMNLIKVFPA